MPVKNTKGVYEMKRVIIAGLALCAALLMISVSGVFATTYNADFTSAGGQAQWNGSITYWSFEQVGTAYVYDAWDNGDTNTTNTSWKLSNSWSWSSDYSIVQEFGSINMGTVLGSVPCANVDLMMNGAGMFLFDQQYVPATNQSLVQVQWLYGGSWNYAVSPQWVNNTTPNGTMTISRGPYSNALTASIQWANGTSWSQTVVPTSPNWPAYVNAMTSVGFRIYKAEVQYLDGTLVTPEGANLTANVTMPNYIGDWSLNKLRVDVWNSAGTSVLASGSIVPTSGSASMGFNMSPGTYTVRANAPGWLTNASTVTVNSTSSTIVPLPLLNGDINGDNFVEDQDYSIMGVGWYQGGN